MNGFGRGRATGRNRWASDHERACQRAAERLSLPLPAAEADWLDRHLIRCSWCAAVAADYALQRERLRSLAEPPPPRDLWARTSAVLDRAERTTGHGRPGASAFPGRAGRPASQGAPIRSLRAERRASAIRATPRASAARARYGRSRQGGGRYAWLVPFGGLAAAAIVIVVGGTIMLTNSLTPTLPSSRPDGGLATGAGPLATPISVGSGQVAWLSAGDDGTYSLNFAQVSQVCPASARPDCAPIPSSGTRHLPTIRVTPHTVLSSPTKSQLVVVDASAKGSGGSLYVVSIPAAVAAPSSSPAVSASIASLPPLGSPTVASPGAASAAPSAPAPTRTPALTAPAESPSPSMASPRPVAPATSAAASASVEASATGSAPPAAPSTEAVASGSAPSASESAAGRSPSPGESTVPSGSRDAGPTPEPTVSGLAIISNVVVVGETAAYSPDGTMLAFSARPADGSHGPDIYLWRLGDATAHAVTTDHASIFSGWLDEKLIGSRAVDVNGRPASTAAGGTLDSGAQAPGPGEAPVAPRPAAPTLPAPSAGPRPAQSGSLYSLLWPFSRFDTRRPDVAASSPSIGDASLDRPTTAGGPAGARAGAATAPTPSDPASPVGPEAIPQSFVIDPITKIEMALAAPAWRPVVDPTGRCVAYWAGTLRYDATTLTWLPARGGLLLALWSALAATDPTATLAPVPLLADGTAGALSSDWDIRWDAAGSHIGLWTADVDDPDVGRLSLLTIDSATARVDQSSVLLQSVPALAGFSIGSDRLAWATPPGQDGQGSRVQVLAWNGANAGNIDSQPVSDGNAVVVVR